MIKILSWGCGVQSTTLAVMSALGDAESLDAIITADTNWEQEETYRLRAWYTDWLRAHGQHVFVVSAGNVRQQGAVEHIHIPFWTSNGGPLRRECTFHFKVKPVRQVTRMLMGFHYSHSPHPAPGSVEMWLGISLDEFTRMSQSRVKFIVNRWPLIEMRISRNGCIDYLKAHDLPVPIKSACVGCPYRAASEWLQMRRESPQDWKMATEFDESNRNNPLAKYGRSTANELYIYQHGGPLESANLEADAARERTGKQLPLMICESGYCMV